MMNSEQREKYSRQILFAGIGEAGQERLLGASAVLVGCGALGTVVANLLVRAGLGRLRIIDRDFVEASNLQRQTLFEEADAREALPKATAAERRLRAINSDARVEGVVADLTPENSAELLGGFELILDGTDNFETRLLVNDVAIARNVPWIYAAAVGSYGVTMTIRPGETACLACLTGKRREGRGAGGRSYVRYGGGGECGGGRDCFDRSGRSDEIAGGKAGGVEPASDFVRRLERAVSIHTDRAEPRLPSVRAARIHVPGWGCAAAYHDVRARLGADS